MEIEQRGTERINLFQLRPEIVSGKNFCLGSEFRSYNLPSLPPVPAPLRAQTSCPTPRDAFVCARVVPPSRLPTPRHTTTTPFLPTHHDLHAVARPPLRCCRSPYTPPLPHLQSGGPDDHGLGRTAVLQGLHDSRCAYLSFHFSSSPPRACRVRLFCRVASRCCTLWCSPGLLRLHIRAQALLRRRESSSDHVYADCLPALRTHIASIVFHPPLAPFTATRAYLPSRLSTPRSLMPAHGINSGHSTCDTSTHMLLFLGTVAPSPHHQPHVHHTFLAAHAAFIVSPTHHLHDLLGLSPAPWPFPIASVSFIASLCSKRVSSRQDSPRPRACFHAFQYDTHHPRCTQHMGQLLPIARIALITSPRTATVSCASAPSARSQFLSGTPSATWSTAGVRS
ncbi:hypothetical protein B0H13DRAFT_2671155 [Mycena leptocephala]|nr:hypothetical protein B0H13DRAFT_2671155 [Mycena leptocephala]